MTADLPPFWDGLAVVWDGWYALPPTFICPTPPPQCCPACGSMAERVTNRARVALATGVTHEDINAREESRDRLPSAAKSKLRRNALYRLFAFRCPDCKRDEVWDMNSGEWWTLDESDYAPAGSFAGRAS